MASKAETICKKLIEVAITDAPLDAQFDGVCVIAESVSHVGALKQFSQVAGHLSAYAKLHAGLDRAGTTVAIPDANGARLIVYASVGANDADFDDARAFTKAGTAAAKQALSAGIRSPVFVVVPSARFANAQLLAVLGALHALYVPLNVRESNDSEIGHKIDKITVHLAGDGGDSKKASTFLAVVNALQAAFQLCRDVGDGDPIRMAPPKVAHHVRTYFANSASVKVEVVEDAAVIREHYPLMAAVSRGADAVRDHQARIIWLEYANEETAAAVDVDFETLFIIGKGVTLDTGGTDVKVGGAMFGMSRDKYGSAVLAGFFAALDALRPRGIRVRGGMCMVRNSVAANSYTCDEIITSRSGKRVQIYNTDAEGRIAMLDPLTHCREQATSAKNPHLITLATLTGHAFLANGYRAAIMDNGPARATQYAEKLQKVGDEFGQPVEISRLCKEDFDFHSAESEMADLRQGGTKPSVQTIRGHMTPAAFLIRGARLDEHGQRSAHPIAFTHIDMGSAMGDMPQVTFPNPLLTLVAHHILPRI